MAFPVRYEPPTPSVQDAELLGETIALPFSKRLLKSRIFKASTGERMSSWDENDLSKRGIPFDRVANLYEIWGQGGYSLIITGQVVVNPEQVEFPGIPIIHKMAENPETLRQFEKMSAAGKASGSLVVVQLSHPGRRVPSHINTQPVSAGDVRLEDAEHRGKPIPLTKEGIRLLESQFVYAAEVAYRTKFDGVQINAAYDFLIAQFLSTKTNNRNDEYGGDILGRSRIVCEIIQQIRDKVGDPEFIIGVKVDHEGFRGQMKDAVDFCQALEKLSVDFIELCGGAYRDAEAPEDHITPLEEFAQEISSSLTKTLVFISGGLRSSEEMAAAIRKKHCASVGVGRPSASDPHLPRKIISGSLGGPIKPDPKNASKGLIHEAVGTQMEALARGNKLFDWSNPDEVLEYKERLQAFQDAREQDLKGGIVRSGCMIWSPGSAV
ncbi:NADH:flavin oxidoreductase/NADH oxidase [Ceratobasidium sp. AG-Ba]|nr:NADH:flavin oxidoreductase/NADH oxidase [Ceratobasidium sp. AG-Ba]